MEAMAVLWARLEGEGEGEGEEVGKPLGGSRAASTSEGMA